jgi:hypothetical protein
LTDVSVECQLRIGGNCIVKPIQLDTTQWPLVRLRIDGKQRDEDVKEFINELRGLAQRGESCVLLVEVGRFGRNLDHVRQLASLAIEEQERSNGLLAGLAFVADSLAFQLMLRSFFSIASPGFPHMVARSREEAIVWLRVRARDANLGLEATALRS